jgi:long-chain acyl-CoA synthetase
MDSDPIAGHPADAPALIEGDRTITYGELRDLVGRTAGGLTQAGVSPGDRVGVVSDNELAFVTGLLAALSVGATASPLPASSPDEVLLSRLSDVEPKAVLVSPAASALGVACRDLVGPDLVGTPAGSPSPDLPAIEAASPVAAVPVDLTAPAVILHTSGIIGAPRAAVLTHHNLRAAQDRMIAYGAGLHASAVGFGALPFNHVMGLNVLLLAHLRVGASLVLQSRWNPVSALELVERHRVTSIVAVPPMWASWADVAGGPSDAMRAVTFARTGASTLHPDVADAAYHCFGIELTQGYGLTETAGTVTMEPAARRHPGSVGRPLPGVELRLVEDGQAVQPGDRGEIWVRTDSVFEGYLDDPVATAEVLLADGWCRTGDVGIQDDDGTLYLVGRSKDLINVSGFNVAPVEVEAVLQQHESVSAAVVVGEPDPVSGERVAAYVTLSPGAEVTPEALIEHCRGRLSGYKVPSSVRVVDRLPLTAIGKRVRAELR